MVDPDRLGGAQRQRGDAEHTAAAPGVEHPLAAPDQTLEQCQRQPGRRMRSAAERALGIDQHFDCSLVWPGWKPRRAHQQPLADGHRPGEGA
ncbi:MAG TPA: hypothetical protein VFH30_18005, partial [Acidimicrobiales bacterium]|nr:hypothetical protein [Acidimicrobiales bacterium]